MKLNLLFSLALAVAIFSTSARAQTNSLSATNDAVVNGYLQIQEQLHATQMAIEDVRAAAADEAKRNAEAIAARLEALEQSVAAQRDADAEAARRTQQITLVLAGAFGLAGLGIMTLMFYFSMGARSPRSPRFPRNNNLRLPTRARCHQLAAPGRAAVKIPTRGCSTWWVSWKEKSSSWKTAAACSRKSRTQKPGNLLAEGQRLLDAGQAQRALDIFDRFLAAQPEHPEALVKKAAALEKLGRLPEALGVCDRAIARDGAFTLAFLQKGGLLNRLNRHDEALNCFEQALLAQKRG